MGDETLIEKRIKFLRRQIKLDSIQMLHFSLIWFVSFMVFALLFPNSMLSILIILLISVVYIFLVLVSLIRFYKNSRLIKKLTNKYFADVADKELKDRIYN